MQYCMYLILKQKTQEFSSMAIYRHGSNWVPCWRKVCLSKFSEAWGISKRSQREIGSNNKSLSCRTYFDGGSGDGAVPLWECIRYDWWYSFLGNDSRMWCLTLKSIRVAGKKEPVADTTAGGGGEEAEEMQRLRSNAPGPSCKHGLFLPSRGLCWR